MQQAAAAILKVICGGPRERMALYPEVSPHETLRVREIVSISNCEKSRVRSCALACPEGLEPPTPSLEGWCSIRLSYGQKCRFSVRVGSLNGAPAGLHAGSWTQCPSSVRAPRVHRHGACKCSVNLLLPWGRNLPRRWRVFCTDARRLAVGASNVRKPGVVTRLPDRSALMVWAASCVQTHDRRSFAPRRPVLACAPAHARRTGTARERYIRSTGPTDGQSVPVAFGAGRDAADVFCQIPINRLPLRRRPNHRGPHAFRHRAPPRR